VKSSRRVSIFLYQISNDNLQEDTSHNLILALTKGSSCVSIKRTTQQNLLFPKMLLDRHELLFTEPFEAL